MKTRAGSCVGRLAVLLGLILVVGSPVAVAADADTSRLDLRAFTFKVRDELANLFGYDDGEGRLFYYTAGAGETTVKLSADGEYEIVIKASCDPALNERAKFKVALDGEAVGMETLLTADEPKDYKLKTSAKAGERKLAIEFTNDAYKENEYDRNFYVHGVTVKRVK